MRPIRVLRPILKVRAQFFKLSKILIYVFEKCIHIDRVEYFLVASFFFTSMVSSLLLLFIQFFQIEVNLSNKSQSTSVLEVRRS